MEFRGSNVKKARLEQGHKQYFFAHLTGISQAHLSKIESEKALPTLVELIKISKFLNRPIHEFVY